MVDITGQKFGRWTVIRKRHDVKLKDKQLAWEMVCDCGTVEIRGSRDVRAGHSKSCGCYKSEELSLLHYKHGGKKTKVYAVWKGMKARCLNPNNKQYQDYGGRGITICPEWLHDFGQFISDMGDRPEGMSIDRINNDLGYNKDNCQWATGIEQANNSRKNRMVEYHGETMTMAQLARSTGATYELLRQKIVNRGQQPEEAVRACGGI